MKNKVNVIKGYVSRVEELNYNIRLVGNNYGYMSRTHGYEDQIEEYRKQKKEKAKIYKNAYEIVNPLEAKRIRINKKIDNLEKRKDNSAITAKKIDELDQKRREIDIKIAAIKIQMDKLEKLKDANREISEVEVDEITAEVNDSTVVEKPEEVEKLEINGENVQISANEDVDIELEDVNINNRKIEELKKQIPGLKALLEEAEENMDFENAEELRKNIKKVETEIEKRMFEQEILAERQEKLNTLQIEFLKAELEIAEDEMNWDEAEEIRKRLLDLQPEEDVYIEKNEVVEPQIVNRPEKIEPPEVENRQEIEVTNNNKVKKEIKDKVDDNAQKNRERIITTAVPVTKQEKSIFPKTTSSQPEQIAVTEPVQEQSKPVDAKEVAKDKIQKNITTAPLKEESEALTEVRELPLWKRAVINIAGFGILVANKVKDLASFMSDKFNIGKEKTTLLIDSGKEKANTASKKFTRTIETGKETIHQLAERVDKEFKNQKNKAIIKYYSEKTLRLTNRNAKLVKQIKSAEENFRDKTRLNDEEMLKYNNRINEIKSEMITKEQNNEEKSEKVIGA